MQVSTGDTAAEEAVWHEAEAEDGAIYYYNVATGKSVWRAPEDKWYRARITDPDKKKNQRDFKRKKPFYFNLARQEATWVQPENYKREFEEYNGTQGYHHLHGDFGLGDKEDYNRYVPAYDSTNGRPYWYNAHMGICTWGKPTSANDSLEPHDAKQNNSELKKLAAKLESDVRFKTESLAKLKVFADQLKTTAENREAQLNKLKKTNGIYTGFNEQQLLGFALTSFAATDSASFLKTVPLFHSLTESQFKFLNNSITTRKYEIGDWIVEQEEDGDMFYLILSGHVDVFINNTVVNRETGNAEIKMSKVNQLYPGDYFGERSLMMNVKRNASVQVATKTVTCATLHRDVFVKALGGADLNSLSENAELSNLHDDLDQRNPSVLSLTKHIADYDNLLQRRKTATTKREAAITDALIGLLSSLSPEIDIVENTVGRMIKKLYGVFKCERINLYAIENGAVLPEINITPEARRGVKFGEGVIGHCAQTNQILNIPDLKNSKYRIDAMDRDTGFQTRSVLCCPICTKDGELLSVLEINNKDGGAQFSEQDEHIIAAVCEQMATPLYHKWKENERKRKGTPLTYTPIWEVEDKVTINFSRFWGSMKDGIIGTDSILVTVSLYHAGVLLAPTMYIQSETENIDPFVMCKFTNLKVTLDMKLKDLPRATRVIFNVYYANPRLQENSLAAIRMNLEAASTVGRTARKTRDGGRKSSADKRRSGTRRKYTTGRTHRQTQRQRKASNSKIKKDGGIGVNASFHMFEDLGLLSKDNLDSDMELRDEILKATLAGARPIGWTGFTLFDFDQRYSTGMLRLKLHNGEDGKGASCDADLAMVAPLLSNDQKKDVDLLEIQIPESELPIIHIDSVNVETKEEENGLGKIDSKKVYADVKEKMENFLYKDPLYKMHPDDGLLIRMFKDALKKDGAVLPKYLRCIQWDSKENIQEAYTYLKNWESPPTIAALELLGPRFPDPKVRALAVSSLESLEDDELSSYLLQLTQVLKFETFVDSALSRFLIRRAIRSPETLGKDFFWYIKAEMHKPEIKNKFGLYVDLYLRHCRGYRAQIGHQLFVQKKLLEIQDGVMKLKKTGVAAQTNFLRDRLSKIVFPERFQLPILCDRICGGINIEKCKVMSSKKSPLYLSFKNYNGGDPILVLFKAGDDLRQDQLTLQVLRIMDKLWRSEGLDLKMSPYECMATGDQMGFLEIVPNSETLSQITAIGANTSFQAAQKVFNQDALKDWLKATPTPTNLIRENFLASCAGYCVATYVLGVGDRHGDNIMLSEDGKMFHIDFGHFLGNYKSKFGIKRERAPFIFTPAMATVIGDPTKSSSKDRYDKFAGTCGKAYNILRKNSNLLITLFALMLSCGIPELQTENDIYWIRQQMFLQATDEEAAAEYERLLSESLNMKFSLYMEWIHNFKHFKNWKKK